MDNPTTLTSDQFKKKTVKWLKEYLHARGIVADKKRKSELVDLAVKAQEINLQVLNDPNEEEIDRQAEIDRRKHRGNIIPSHEVIKSWSNDLKNVPLIDI